MRKVTKTQRPDVSASIGEKITYIRTNKGISQYELANAVFKSRQEINYFEKGTRKPDIETLILIAKYLEVSLDYLVGINDIEKPNSDLQGIYEVTGLSEKAIYVLSKFKGSKEILSQVYEEYELAGIEKEEQKLAILNRLIENPKFEDILNHIVDYENLKKEIENQPTDLTFQRHSLKTMEDKKEFLEFKITKKINEILNEN